MQVPEFKAWFEGFSEAMTGPPTDEQWARIKAQVEEIDYVVGKGLPPPLDILPGPAWTAPWVIPGSNYSTTGGTDAPRTRPPFWTTTTPDPPLTWVNLTRWASSGEAFTA